MLERFWLILILVLASIVPPMHAAQGSPVLDSSVSCACAASSAMAHCACDGCPCASNQPTEEPADQTPAVPAPRPELRCVAEQNFDFSELILEAWSGPNRIDPDTSEPALNTFGIRIESLLCVWRI